ncbi:MAG: DUF342 domain-containing protein [Hespellia sp.]|nr:DUF342 domain-containing protein [Hespellia sp.]
MSLKNIILSKIFGTHSTQIEEETISPEVQETTPSIPDSAPPLDPTQLALSDDHALIQLWRIWTDQKEWMPVPVLRLEGPTEQREILDAEELKKELSHLESLITSTAESRLLMAVPPEQEPLAQSTSESDSEQEAEEDTTTDELEPSVPDLDAQVITFLTYDQMHAWLLIYPPVGEGQELNRNMLTQALDEQQISFGVNKDLLDALPEHSERYFHLFLIAQGQSPVHGKDGYTIDSFPRKTNKTVPVDEHGRVNYAELNLVNNVNEGDLICQIFPPTMGNPGTTVLNHTLPAKDGKKVSVPKGRNTELTEDESKLIASKSGHVEFDGRNFQIKPVMDIGGDVDYSTGNINFMGDLHIRGDVRSGFTVRAMGNIHVDGVVEACSIEAGGSLLVVKGVKGDGQAIIRAGRSIFTKYLENSSICTRENLQTDCIINSDVYSDGMVDVSSGRGIIIGGRIRAASGVKANTVGSKSGIITAISLGGAPSEDFEYENILWEIEQLEKEYEKIERQPDSPAKLRNLPMVRMKLSVNKNKLQQYEKLLEELNEDTPDQINPRLVCGIAYPGTEITIGEATLHLKDETSHCTATLEDGEICLKL